MVPLTFPRARTEEKKRQRAAAIVGAARSPTFTCNSSTRWISTGLSISGGPAPLAKCCSRMRSSRRSGALNVLLATYSLAAPLWQIAHPPQRLIDAFAEEPEVPPDWNLDFGAALTQLLTATCVGLLSESAEQTLPDNPMRSTTRTSWRHGRTRPSCHSAPDRTVVFGAAMGYLQVQFLLAQLC